MTGRLGAPRRAPRRIKKAGWRLITPVIVDTGELHLSDGANAAVALATWLGDGIYPVYARYATSEYFPGELRIAEIRVIFDGSEAPA